MVGFQSLEFPGGKFELRIVLVELLGALAGEPGDTDVKQLSEFRKFFRRDAAIAGLDLRD